MNELFFQLNDITSYLTFFLVLLRIGGFFQTMPLFSAGTMPILVKIFFSLILTIFFFNFIPPPIINFSLLNTVDYLIIGVKEVVVGIFLGLLLRTVFFAVLYAADLISNMIGFSYASFFNPQDNQPSVVLGLFFEILALLLFLSLNYHHYLVEFIFRSYQIAPPFSFNLNNFSYVAAADFIAMIFNLGLIFAAPMVTTSVILNLSLGFTNRSVPQMNVFLVGASLLVLLSIVFMAISLNFFGEAFKTGWGQTLKMINSLTQQLLPTIN